MLWWLLCARLCARERGLASGEGAAEAAARWIAAAEDDAEPELVDMVLAGSGDGECDEEDAELDAIDWRADFFWGIFCGDLFLGGEYVK